jgi:hypothetical protein
MVFRAAWAGWHPRLAFEPQSLLQGHKVLLGLQVEQKTLLKGFLMIGKVVEDETTQHALVK